MRYTGGRGSVVLIEALETRQLLAFDDVAAPTADAQEAGSSLTLDATPEVQSTTTTLNLPAVLDEGPVTLEAVVRGTDPQAPGVTGTVGFFVVGWAYTSSALERYADLAEVWLNRADYGWEQAFLLGTAPVGPDGSARLDLGSLPLGAHRIVAVFLGKDPMVGPSGMLYTNTLFVTEQPQSMTGFSVLETYGRPFRIQAGTVWLLDETPAGAHTVPHNGVRVKQTRGSAYSWYLPSGGMSLEDYLSPPADFAPTNQRVYIRQLPSIGFGDSEFDLIPIGVPQSLQVPSAEWSSSSSAITNVKVTAATKVALELHGQTTLTNPPVFTATIVRPDGALVSRYWAATPPARGEIMSATAGLTVTIPSTPTGSYSYAGRYNAGLSVSWGWDPAQPGSVRVTSRHAPRPVVSGTVTFYDGDQVLGTASLNADGTATFTPPIGALTLGTHQIHAVYGGDAHHRSGDSEQKTIPITQTPTSVTLAPPAKTSVRPGESLSLKATVMTLVPDLVDLRGTVTFYADDVELKEVRVGDNESFEVDLPAGTYQLRAVYDGLDVHAASESTDPVTITVEKLQARLALVGGKPVKTGKQSLTVVPRLKKVWPSMPPQGRVVITIGEREVGSGKVGKPIKLKLPKLAPGTYSAYGHYSGDDNTHESTSERYEIVVTAKRTSWGKPTEVVQPPYTWPTMGYYGDVLGNYDSGINANDYFLLDQVLGAQKALVF